MVSTTSFKKTSFFPMNAPAFFSGFKPAPKPDKIPVVRH